MPILGSDALRNYREAGKLDNGKELLAIRTFNKALIKMKDLPRHYPQKTHEDNKGVPAADSRANQKAQRDNASSFAHPDHLLRLVRGCGIPLWACDSSRDG